MTEAETGRPDAIDSAVKAWRDAFVALAKMPVVFGLATLAMIALNAIGLWLLPFDATKTPGFSAQLLGFAFGLVQGFLITPVAIAVHRYVLLGDITQGYLLNPSDPRFLRFFIFTVAFQILVGIPSTLMSLSSVVLGGAGALVLGVVAFALFIVAAIVALRALILFPAVAVDAPGADWRNAMADTKGHTWRVFFVMVVASLPAFAVQLPLYFLLLWPSGPSFPGGVIAAVIQSVVGIVTIAAFAAAASRLYYAFGAQLGRPPGLRM